MTQRERVLETLLFGQPDRIPFAPGGGRESTLRRWRQEGLGQNENPMDALYKLINHHRLAKGLPQVDFEPQKPVTHPGVSFQMIPTFEEKILEHKNGHYIVQDWMGAITEISDEYDYTYIRSAKDFVTRKWHKFPVENRADWENMKWRFNPNDPRRFPIDFEQRCKQLLDRDYYLEIHFNGPFWQLREFCGFEGLCRLMLEDPTLVLEMASFWTDFCSQLLERIFQHVTPDGLHFSEDMAFKEHPMISPEMTRMYCAPSYRQWVEMGKSAGVQIFAIDSDGRVDMLVPVWLECGINCIDPMEVAAGNDINEFRKTFGKKLAFRGGIDKRAIAAGGQILEKELQRITPVLRDGGYIPGCDHGVPPDVSWQNFQEYALKLADLTGWLT